MSFKQKIQNSERLLVILSAARICSYMTMILGMLIIFVIVINKIV